jgi:hypothetical protein
MKNLILAFILSVVSSFALAAEPKQIHVLTIPEEQDIHQRAKKRLYPGGQDEESLKVQAQLQNITRKMSPASENQIEDNDNGGDE